MADLARFPRVRNLSLRDPLRDPETDPVLKNLPSQGPVGIRTRDPRGVAGVQRTVPIPQGDVFTPTDRPTQVPIPFLNRTGAPGEPPTPITFESTFGADFDPDRYEPPGPRTGLGIDFPRAVEAGATSISPTPTPTPSGTTSAPIDVGFEQFAQRNQGLRPGGQGDPVLSGPRIIRRPGESPLLTNLSGSQLDARQADVGQAAADILRSGIAKGNFQSISNADDISGGGLRSRVAGGGTGETSDSPTIADLLSTTSDINLGGLQAAGALSTDLFNRREKGIRNRQKDRELGVQEVNAAGSLAKNLKVDEPNLTDKLRALGDVKIVSNPVSGTADLQVGNSLIPEALRPQWENFSANIRLTPEFIAEHGSKSPAEQDRIAARQAAEFMEEQGTISSGAPRSGIDALQTALGG